MQVMAQLRPTFSESWYRVADLKVRLRPSAQISRQFYRGERWYVVRDPAGNQYHRLSAAAYSFVGLLDGTRTVAEAWELVGGQLADSAPTQNEVIQILSQLHSANLIESNVTPDAAVLLRRHKKMVQRQWKGRLMNVLFPRIPLWDPDRFLVRWMPIARVLFSRIGAIIWLLVVGAAIVSLVPEWPRLAQSARGAIAPDNWFYLYVVFVITKVLHELGHAFACRRFGGEVHELGIMFLVLFPCPYVDASTAWSFPSKWQRIFVGLAGMIVELFVAALAAFVWLMVRPDSLGSTLAYNAMLIASVSTILFNANPLLRFDGYYILSDWLEIPNLRQKASEYTLGLVKRHLFKVKLPNPLPPVGQRIWLVLFGVLSTIYRTWIGLMIILMVWHNVPILGALMALGGIITWLVVPIVKLFKYLLIEPELHRKRVRASLWTASIAAAIIILIGGIPFTVEYLATAYVAPAEQSILYAQASGRVEQIVARDGQTLKEGDVILICRNEETEAQIARLQALIRALEARLRQAEGNPIEQGQIRDEIAIHQRQLDQAELDFARLTVRAPMSGVLIAPELHHLAGRFVHRGDELLTVARAEDLRVYVVVPQTDAVLPYRRISRAAVMLAGNRQPLEGQLEGRSPTPIWDLPYRALGYAGGGDVETDPADPKGLRLLRPHIQLWVTLPNAQSAIFPGQRARVKFTLDHKEPLIWNWSRRFWQLIQTYGSGSRWI
jgi:putative peptide zinc metalloprotease protein